MLGFALLTPIYGLFFIHGKTGTGKELVPEAIHYNVGVTQLKKIF